MNRTFYISTFFIFLITQFLFINPIKFTLVASADNRRNNSCGIAWSGTPADNTKYANQDEGRVSQCQWILELWRIYNAANNDEQVNQIKDREGKDELTPDMLFQKSFAGTMVYAPFVDNTNNFKAGVNITKDMVGITQPTLE